MKTMVYPNIEAERARNGMSVEDLTRLLGVCRKTYHNWIRKGQIPQKKLEHMAEIFNVSSDYLLGRIKEAR